MDEELLGTVVGVTWRADDGSAVIARVAVQQPALKKSQQTVTVKGPDGVPPLRPDLTCRFLGGRWDRHEKYGEQFAFSAYTACQPEDRRGVVAYLTSLCDGVGEGRAGKLWDAYGPLAVQALRESPEDAAEKAGIPLNVALQAAAQLEENRRWEATRVELLGLLAGRGFQLQALLRELIARWGSRAPEVIRRNPYALLTGGFTSCGWKRVDRLYLDLGHDAARLKRQALYLLHRLGEGRDGDTWTHADRVAAAVEEAVGKTKADPVRAMRLARRAGRLAVRHAEGGPWVALAGQAREEAQIANKLEELSRWTGLLPRSARRRSAHSSPGTWPATG